MFISLAMGFGIMAVKEVQSPMAFALLNQSHLLLTLAKCSQDTGPVPSKLWPMGQPDQKTPADSGYEPACGPVLSKGGSLRYGRQAFRLRSLKLMWCTAMTVPGPTHNQATQE